jgi:hypothetical protein
VGSEEGCGGGCFRRGGDAEVAAVHGRRRRPIGLPGKAKGGPTC